MVQEISGKPLKKSWPTYKQLKQLLNLSKKQTLLKIKDGQENLNLMMDELKPDIMPIYKRELLKTLFRDIDFLCRNGIIGYKVEIMVEENLNDRMLSMFNN